MRGPLFVLCATLVVVIRTEDPAPVDNNYFNRQLEPVNMATDQETISYLLPKLAAKYRPNNDWTGVTDPRFYLLTEMESNNFDNQYLLRQLITGLEVYKPSNLKGAEISELFQARRKRLAVVKKSVEVHVANNRRIRNKRYNFDVYEPRQTRYDFGEEPSLSINANIQNLRQAYAKTKYRERLAANRKFLENLRDSQ